jgi:hypothetical protein
MIAKNAATTIGSYTSIDMSRHIPTQMRNNAAAPVRGELYYPGLERYQNHLCWLLL